MIVAGQSAATPLCTRHVAGSSTYVFSSSSFTAPTTAIHWLRAVRRALGNDRLRVVEGKEEWDVRLPAMFAIDWGSRVAPCRTQDRLLCLSQSAAATIAALGRTENASSSIRI